MRTYLVLATAGLCGAFTAPRSALARPPRFQLKAEPEAPEKKAARGPDLDENPEQPDIIKKFVKQRDDWWDGPLTGIGSGAQKNGPIGALLLKAPLPSYFFLLTATVLSIAFVGCVFQIFYVTPGLGRAPVIGLPATTLILLTSGPAFIFSFLCAVARGQQEADEDDRKYGK
ncbi:hypothetical protein M885DRAFT_542281 [Pelagophyceae sp. CCMP2097]|nr:hypothetical protein M885DRAFT_542281 [Pelagophyceae sp. CCMP2097]|mmetsp:Transcript_2974/g.10781  ORF Transcript_2974/g.10781 Transcript_2974/m.10781 type:complete len:172 (-) Transcript_2974:33-548(-)